MPDEGPGMPLLQSSGRTFQLIRGEVRPLATIIYPDRGMFAHHALHAAFESLGEAFFYHQFGAEGNSDEFIAHTDPPPM